MELALFDFDHTITDRDSYAGFLRRIATPDALKQARWKIGPWLLAYRATLVSAEALRRRVTRLAFAGRDAGEVGRLAQTYAEEALPAMLRPEMMQRIAWHQAQGHEVAVVSASLDAYLRTWCERHGITGLICNALAAKEGRLTGEYAGGEIGMRKAALIHQHHDLSRYHRIHAYGDSREDRPILALAQAQIAKFAVEARRWYCGKRVA